MAGDTVGNAAGERAFFVAASGAATISDPPERAPAISKRTDPARELVAVPGVVVSRKPVFAALASATASALDLEHERGGLFLAATVLLCAGAATYFLLPAEPGAVPLAAYVLALSLGAVLLRRRPAPFRIVCAALVFLCGVLAGKVQTVATDTPMLGSEISTRLTGRIVAIEQRANGRYRYLIDVMATERPHLRYAPDRVRVTARDLPSGARAGSIVVGIVRLMPPSGPVRPQSYDFSFENYFDEIGAIGFFLRGPDLVTDAPPASGRGALLSAWVENARLAVAARLRSIIGGAEGEIAAALVAGVRAGIPEEANEALRRTGLAHILSISGLHMALVAGTVLVATRKIFAMFPDFSSRHAVKKYAATLALLAVALYLVISGAAVAAQRSFIMISVMLVALLFDRAALTMRNLAIAALVVVAISPHEVLGPSFQMSFAATAALIGSYSAWTNRRAGRLAARAPPRGIVLEMLRKPVLFFFAIATTSIIAGTATGLYGAWHFQRAAPLGLLANLLAMPLVSLGVMPMALCGMLLMPFGLDVLPFWLMGKAIGLVLAVAGWVSSLSPIDEVGIVPPASVVILTAALVLLTMATTWLRWLALPLIVAGMATLVSRATPDLFISEDGRLVAMRTADGNLAVNRARPNAFALDNWIRAAMAGEVVKPDAGSPPDDDGAKPVETGFLCDGDGNCIASHASGHRIGFAVSAEAAPRYCGVSVLVVDDATARDLCASTETLVITKRDLAQRGSAALHLAPGSPPDVVYAISRPYRPWHAHRRYSREARGLAPYQRKKAPAKNEAPPSPDRDDKPSTGGSGRPGDPGP